MKKLIILVLAAASLSACATETAEHRVARLASECREFGFMDSDIPSCSLTRDIFRKAGAGGAPEEDRSRAASWSGQPRQNGGFHAASAAGLLLPGAAAEAAMQSARRARRIV